MSYALVYVAGRFLFRVADFFHDWYIEASRHILHHFLSALERLDRRFALAVTVRHFGEPLYGDYSPVGRLLGFLFRSGRILAGGFLYLAMSIAFLAGYIAWLTLPILIILLMVSNIPGGAPTLPY